MVANRAGEVMLTNSQSIHHHLTTDGRLLQPPPVDLREGREQSQVKIHPIQPYLSKFERIIADKFTITAER